MAIWSPLAPVDEIRMCAVAAQCPLAVSGMPRHTRPGFLQQDKNNLGEPRSSTRHGWGGSPIERRSLLARSFALAATVRASSA
jgi:hypothetical protein